MARFRAKNEEEKLLSKEQFKEVFFEYLRLMDDFDGAIRSKMEQIKSVRYHVEIGLEEHPDLCRELFKEYEALNSQEKRKLG